MPAVIPVKFAYAARDLWFDPGTTDAQEGDHVICSTERGTEIGLATASARTVSRSELSHMIGNASLKSVIRVADDDDLARAELQAQRGEDALPLFRRMVDKSGLDIKPVGVEYLFGGEKVVCYFAAEERVDFRQLVRDLSHELHERIDMRQIGVREEAAVVGGFGHCGQELCCARFGLAFEPVSIRMAKEQDLPLTSNKISGACGRLMCCLRYEFEAYRDFKGRAPKRNAVIDTPLGKAKIVEYDTPKEQICLRIENGKTVRIPLAEMVASEAAVKKSEELHCPCRPDTVVRESLEKLSSPDVQMALAELDRKMGVVPADTFDSDDLFVDSKPRKRRSRVRNATAKDEASADQQPTKGRRTRRRRTGKTNEAVEVASGEQAGTTSAQDGQEKKPRRRRRKRSGTAPAQDATMRQTSSDEGQTTEGGARRRRHHKSVDDKSVAERGAKQSNDAQERPRRRPGDRGGQKVQAQQDRQTNAQQISGGEAAPKRRRRRRSGRGRGKGTQGGEQQTPKE